MSTKAVLRFICIVPMSTVFWCAAQAQDWHTNGNAGTNPGANFVGTTDNTALVIRTNGIPRIWINGSEPLYASGSGHVGIGFGMNSPEGILHVYNRDPGATITDDLIVSHRGARNGDGGTAISLRVLGNEMASIKTQNDAPDGGSLRIHTRNAATVTERMRITNSGNVGIGTSQPDHPLFVRGLLHGDNIVFQHVTGPGRAAMGTANGGDSGGVVTLGPNGNLNAAMLSSSVAVFDAAENAKALMLVDVNGDGWVVADVKSFRMPYPGKADTDIVYAAIEGPEAAAYVRGTAHLVNGEAAINLPEHFASVASNQGLTVQLTPSSSKSLGLAVEEKSTKRIVVRELMGGKGNYDFDWEVKCVRKGYENYRVIRPHKDLAIGLIDRRGVSEKTK